MNEPVTSGGLKRLLPERQSIAWVVGIAAISALLLQRLTRNTYIEIFGEFLFVGIVLLGAFTAAGAWKQNFVPRPVAQVLGVALAAPFGPLIVQLLTARGSITAFLDSRPHVNGFVLVTVSAAVIGTSIAIGAIIREKQAKEESRMLQANLDQETLERRAADTRLRLMTAQIQPHFLLNTLANVQELVETGSPRAVPVFRSLIEYLRAALPQVQQEDGTLASETRLVRAYLELMHMRMPDRLSYSVQVDDAIGDMHFPPMALLTLVENAIEHGVDPSVDPAHVDVGGRRVDAKRVHLWVTDTGVGMSETSGEGTGLANLAARLKAAFGADARVDLSEVQPHGVRADVYLTAAA